MPVHFKLQFPTSEVAALAGRYLESLDEETLKLEERLIQEVGPRSRERGFVDGEDFLALVRWKGPRTLTYARRSPEHRVREATRMALETSAEDLRLDVLQLLSGVGVPVASVILHFCHPEPYPIVDFRAFRSLGVEELPNPLPFEDWWEYVQTCRGLAAATDASMRDLDRALWQYDRELHGR